MNKVRLLALRDCAPAFLATACLLLGACSTLPSSGPTAADIDDGVEHDTTLGMKIVDLSPQVLDVLSQLKPPSIGTLQEQGQTGGGDTIGVGDTLSVSVFEAGPGLFAAHESQESGATAGQADSGAARSTTLPNLLVDRTGAVVIPYAGRIELDGLLPEQAAQRIEDRLQGKSLRPQVLVSILNRISNSVMVYGDVRNPGRYPLTLAREHLLDVIALAGGGTRAAQDMVVTLNRQKQAASLRLSDIYALSDDNVELAAGDRIQLQAQPRSYTVFGATGRVSEVMFDATRLSLAQAVARSGGPSDSQADPSAVYLFRYELDEAAKRLGLAADQAPVIYRVDLMKPESYFFMQKFPMRDGDMIYVANARTNRLQKALNLFSALVSPAVVGRELSP